MQQESKEVIVLGSPRSGTSMTAGVLSILGVDMGEVRQPDFENPTGYYEDIEISRLIEDIFKETDPYSDGFHPPSMTLLKKKLVLYRKRAQQIVMRRRKKTNFWGWKVPSLIFILELLLPYLQNPHFVIVVRKPLNIASSMIKYGQRKGYRSIDTIYALRLCAFYYSEIFSFLDNHRSFPYIVVAYEDAIEDPKKFVNELASFLQIKPTYKQLAEVEQFVNPRIKRLKFAWRLRYKVRLMLKRIGSIKK